MICNVQKQPGLVRGYITEGPGSDTYVFDLDEPGRRWEYLGKHHGPSFISAQVQGYEHIPQEFWMALDAAWYDPNGHHEFPDPLLDDLAVAGS